MRPIVRGKYVLYAISQLKEPADLIDIVDYLAPNFKEPKARLTKIVKDTLDAGVRYGFIDQYRDAYYSQKPNEDAMPENETEFNAITSDDTITATISNDQELNDGANVVGDQAKAKKKSVRVVKKRVKRLTKSPARKNRKVIFPARYNYISNSEDSLEDGLFGFGRSSRSCSSKRSRSSKRSCSSKRSSSSKRSCSGTRSRSGKRSCSSKRSCSAVRSRSRRRRRC